MKIRSWAMLLLLIIAAAGSASRAFAADIDLGRRHAAVGSVTRHVFTGPCPCSSFGPGPWHYRYWARRHAVYGDSYWAFVPPWITSVRAAPWELY